MGLSLRLGLGLSSPSMGGGVSSWVPRGADNQPALFTLDAANDRGWFRSTSYASEAALLTATGGTAAGEARSFAPYPIGPELFPDGGFVSGLDSWASSPTFASAGSIAHVTDRARLTLLSASTAYRARRQFTVTANRAYILTGSAVAQSGGLGSASLNASANTDLSPSVSSAFSPIGSLPQTRTIAYSSPSSTLYAGVSVTQTAGAERTLDIDTYTLTEGSVINGFSLAGWGFEWSGDLPAVASGNKVLVTFGEAGERSYVKLLWDASGNLRLIVRWNNAEQANLDLGVQAPGSAVAFEGTVATNRVGARVNGGASITDVAVNVVSPAMLWLGRSFTGETFDGDMDTVSIFTTERIMSDLFYLEGDSYPAGAGGVGLFASLTADTAYRGFSTAAGSSTIQEQAARVIANPGLCRRGSFIHWDGRHNGWVDLTTYMAAMTAMVSAYGADNYLLIPPVAVPGDDAAYIAETVAIRDAMIAAFGAGHVLDWRDYLSVSAGAVAAGELADGVHLNDAAMDKMVTPVAAWLATL